MSEAGEGLPRPQILNPIEPAKLPPRMKVDDFLTRLSQVKVHDQNPMTADPPDYEYSPLFLKLSDSTVAQYKGKTNLTGKQEGLTVFEYELEFRYSHQKLQNENKGPVTVEAVFSDLQQRTLDHIDKYLRPRFERQYAYEPEPKKQELIGAGILKYTGVDTNEVRSLLREEVIVMKVSGLKNSQIILE